MAGCSPCSGGNSSRVTASYSSNSFVPAQAGYDTCAKCSAPFRRRQQLAPGLRSRSHARHPRQTRVPQNERTRFHRETSCAASRKLPDRALSCMPQARHRIASDIGRLVEIVGGPCRRSSKPSISAARPPRRTANLFSNSGRDSRKRSSVGRCIVFNQQGVHRIYHRRSGSQQCRQLHLWDAVSATKTIFLYWRRT